MAGSCEVDVVHPATHNPIPSASVPTVRAMAIGCARTLRRIDPTTPMSPHSTRPMLRKAMKTCKKVKTFPAYGCTSGQNRSIVRSRSGTVPPFA